MYIYRGQGHPWKPSRIEDHNDQIDTRVGQYPLRARL